MLETTERLISDLSVIIVTWNGDDLLRNCLASMVPIYGANLEIVVVDNANQQSTRELVEGFGGCRYVPTAKNLGFAGGNNVGLAYCSRRYVLLLNNDTVVHEDSFSPMVRYIVRNPNVAVVQGTMVLPLRGGKLDVCGWRIDEKCRLIPNAENAPIDAPPADGAVFAAKGAMLMFRRDIVDRVGGVLFHDCFHCEYEEIDFCHRVWLAGYQVHYVNTPPIDHLQGRTVSRVGKHKVSRQAFANRLYSSLTLKDKHFYWWVSKKMVMDVAWSFYSLLRGHFHESLYLLFAIGFCLRRVTEISVFRRLVLGFRKFDDRGLVAALLAAQSMADD